MPGLETPSRRHLIREVFERDVAPGVHRLGAAAVNCYLLQDGRRLTLVDAGLPGMRRLLDRALAELGLGLAAIEAVVLTHGHFDHVGLARGLRDRGVPVWVHEGDGYLAAHPYRYRPLQPRLAAPLAHPQVLPVFAAMVGRGALAVRGVTGLRRLRQGRLDVPGAPTVVPTPGHTYGHVALHLADAGTVLSGDAIVTFDPYTGRTEPCIVSTSATTDPQLARESAARIGGLDGDVLLPGHGEPWRGPVSEAAARAASAGTD